MFAIACISQKGGVGKSTIARLLARTYADADWAVKIADFNTKQKTSVDWAALRLESGHSPPIPAEVFSSVRAVSKQLDKFDLVVFDGRPDSDTSTRELAAAANMVVIPTGVTRDDLAPQIMFAVELTRHIGRQKIIFVLNKVADSKIAIEEARSIIQTAGFAVAKAHLTWQAGYQIAQDAGKAISETSFTSLNERAESMAAELVERMNQLTGR